MLAGAQDAYAAAFEQAGMIMVEDFASLIETAAFFAKADPDAADGVVVLASSGGASVMAADKAEIHDVPLPQPSEATRAAIQERLPDFGTARNPCDVTGGVANDLDTFFACVDLLMAEPRYGMLATAHPYSVHTANRVRRFSELGAKYDKLVAHVWITEYLAGPGLIEAEGDARAAVFRSMERCFATIGAWREWRQRREALLALPASAGRLSDPSAARRADALLDGVEGSVLTERQAKTLLALYGVPVVGEHLAQSASEATAAAERLTFPVALKLESPDVLHKTEAGVIRLAVADAGGVEQAYAEIMAAAARIAPAPRINGVLVQEMAPAGVRVDRRRTVRSIVRTADDTGRRWRVRRAAQGSCRCAGSGRPGRSGATARPADDPPPARRLSRRRASKQGAAGRCDRTDLRVDRRPSRPPRGVRREPADLRRRRDSDCGRVGPEAANCGNCDRRRKRARTCDGRGREDGMTYIDDHQLVGRAKAMAHGLAARASQQNADRRISADTIAEMKDAGFFRVLQPKLLGRLRM